MKLEIINNKKLDWSYVKKAMVKITHDTLNYEAALSVSELTRIHFITGNLLADYYEESEHKP